MRYFGIEAESREAAQEQMLARVGANIAALRRMRGWTQDDLARELGTSAQTLSNYERGETCISYATAMTLCDLFGVGMNVLGGRVDFEPGAVA